MNKKESESIRKYGEVLTAREQHAIQISIVAILLCIASLVFLVVSGFMSANGEYTTPKYLIIIAGIVFFASLGTIFYLLRHYRA